MFSTTAVPLLTKKRQSRTIKDYLRTFKEGCEQTVRRFEDAIERAKESCKSASQPIEKHFADAGKMYKIPLESFMLISQASCRSQGCRIAHVRPQMQHTPPCDGAYVALECAGGRFCYPGFGRVRGRPGMSPILRTFLPPRSNRQSPTGLQGARGGGSGSRGSRRAPRRRR